MKPTPLTDHRIFVRCSRFEADGNILNGHPVENAEWIWADSWQPGTSSFIRWRAPFTVTKAMTLRFHISADQRFQCYGDGQALC